MYQRPGGYRQFFFYKKEKNIAAVSVIAAAAITATAIVAAAIFVRASEESRTRWTHSFEGGGGERSEPPEPEPYEVNYRRPYLDPCDPTRPKKIRKFSLYQGYVLSQIDLDIGHLGMAISP